MTLIAFNATAEAIDVVTDTIAYSYAERLVTRSVKCLVIPHLEMAIAVQGSALFGALWKYSVINSSVDELLGVRTLDDLNAAAPAVIGRCWDETVEAEPDVRARTGVPLVLHFGWSPERGTHTVTAFDPFNAFAASDCSGLYCATGIDGAMDWDFLNRPTTDADWVGAVVRERDKQLAHSGVLIGGELMLTHIEGHVITQRRIHSFDEDELARLDAAALARRRRMQSVMSGLGRNDPCRCGSGRKYKHCCLTFTGRS